LKAVVIIPARYTSTRFPGKPLAGILGKPLIEHVYLRAREAKTVDRVVVATDDRRIFEAVRQFGGDCVMTAGDHRSGSDRLGEVAKTLEADVVVNVQGDEPLIDPDIIDGVIRVHEGGRAPDIATVAVPIGNRLEYSDRHVVKVVTDNRGYALYFSRAAIPHGWEQGEYEALRHVGIYAYSRAALLKFVSMPPGRLEKAEDLEQLRALENGMSIYVVKVHEFNGVGVDRPEDIAKVEAMMRDMRSGPAGSAPGKAEGGL
jgi:3-deoxy-manno-octulosonate cytidylyltransferase (CMP-KDO synthetase)